MKREFFYQDDRSNKFWTVGVEGSVVVTTNGRIGAKPKETRKAHANPAAAEREAEKLIAAKLKAGYREGAIAEAPAHQKPDWGTMAMSETVFWRIIKLFNWKKTGDDDAVLEPALVALAQMPVENIEKFEAILAEKLFALDTEAHARNTGEDAYVDDVPYFSVDTFLYARCVVVANGEEFFRKVLADPTAMPKDMEFESLLYLSGSAYARKTGSEFEYHPPADYETFSNKAGWGA
ncbi:MAG: DUF4240 domain-containing protein [Myxococcales bacterium]|nr:DUF4240 domain-containing protein [Myxococcales bacterium]